MAQDLFQEAMDTITRDLNGVISIDDDICIFGADETDHDENLQKLMLRAREHGQVFNKAKCSIKVQEITFFGSICSKHGVKPDPGRVMKSPTYNLQRMYSNSSHSSEWYNMSHTTSQTSAS